MSNAESRFDKQLDAIDFKRDKEFAVNLKLVDELRNGAGRLRRQSDYPDAEHRSGELSGSLQARSRDEFIARSELSKRADETASGSTDCRSALLKGPPTRNCSDAGELVAMDRLAEIGNATPSQCCLKTDVSSFMPRERRLEALSPGEIALSRARVRETSPSSLFRRKRRVIESTRSRVPRPFPLSRAAPNTRLMICGALREIIERERRNLESSDPDR